MDGIEIDVLKYEDEDLSISSDEKEFHEGGIRTSGTDSSAKGKKRESITTAMVSHFTFCSFLKYYLHILMHIM